MFSNTHNKSQFLHLESHYKIVNGKSNQVTFNQNRNPIINNIQELEL
uniref:Uncharacterized protein n=1 Tax=Rhizophora mucronata TaxID=61149 RepID=A0A2P2IUH3_RHIMU